MISMISITRSSKNFSTEAKPADQKSKTAIMKSNRPADLLAAFKEDQISFPSSQEVEDSADKFLEKYSSDFQKLAE